MTFWLHFHSIDWEEFHERFSVDLVEANKETDKSAGIVFESFFAFDDSAKFYPVDEFNDSEIDFLKRIYGNLKKACSPQLLEKVELGAFTKFWRRFLRSTPSPDVQRSPIILEPGTDEFEFCTNWLKDFEFVFSRLSPSQFSESGRYRDSPIDFSSFESDGLYLNTLSPETVGAIFARFPSPKIADGVIYRTIINTPEHQWQSPFHDHHHFKWVLETIEEIAHNASSQNKGLCIFVV